MGETSEQKSVILNPFPVRMEEPFEPVVIEDTYAKWCMSDNRETEMSSLQSNEEFGEFRQTMREFAIVLRGITSSSQNQGNGNGGQNMSALSEFKRLNPPTFNGRQKQGHGRTAQCAPYFNAGQKLGRACANLRRAYTPKYWKIALHRAIAKVQTRAKEVRLHAFGKREGHAYAIR
ncbi:hypothetical protein OWV82_012731 [Melia azedarach]|uniref:Uncharacterized protein n=1 Tax=Melia azedarach TaxID=155640 RepID=A0ACC1XTZ3_MELAZ|nr:hypothetical protein OWV82_012731 [Melia azedarach]